MNHYSPIVAALVTMLLTTILLHSRFGKKVQDIPNARSLHAAPIPRIGGVALMGGTLISWTLMLDSLRWWLLLPLSGLFVISLLDDVYHLPVKKRLLIHLVAAAFFVVGSGLFVENGIFVALPLLLLTVWVTNLYNFMDGSDGLAGGMALFGFTFYGLAALIAHNESMAMLNFSIAAAALGFLFSNFHPAKIFMGDAGSIPLGFLAISMGLWGWQLEYWPFWFPFFVFSPFIVDASITLAKRTIRGVKITEAHREHYYQRAIQLGLGHRNVALIEYALMLAVGTSALWVMDQQMPWKVLLVWAAIYAGLMLLLDARWNRAKRTSND